MNKKYQIFFKRKAFKIMNLLKQYFSIFIQNKFFNLIPRKYRVIC